MEKITKNLNFAYHENYGYLNTLPSNLGIGMYYKFLFSLSDKKENHEQIKSYFKNNQYVHCEILNQNEKYYLELSNTSSFYNFSSFLIDLVNIKQYFL